MGRDVVCCGLERRDEWMILCDGSGLVSKRRV
jgi:hypothetical protein